MLGQVGAPWQKTRTQCDQGHRVPTLIRNAKCAISCEAALRESSKPVLLIALKNLNLQGRGEASGEAVHILK
jgi:hypothetical protein